jgi:hypothetical protein
MYPQLYAVCLPVLCLPTWIMSARLYMSAYMYDAWLPVLMMSAYLCDTMSCYLYDVFLHEWCLPTFMIPSYLDDVCYLYDVCSAVCCLLTCIMSAYLYDVFSTVRWLSAHICLLKCVMSAYVYDISSTVWRPPTCVMSVLLCNFCLPLWCVLPYFDVCLPVWWLLPQLLPAPLPIPLPLGTLFSHFNSHTFSFTKWYESEILLFLYFAKGCKM